MQLLCGKIIFVTVVGNLLLCMYVAVIIVNLCKTGRLTSLCIKHAVENVGLSYLINFSHSASLHCKGLDLAVLVCWIVPKYVLEYYVLKLASYSMIFLALVKTLISCI